MKDAASKTKPSAGRKAGRRPAGAEDVRARILAKTCELLNTVPPDKLSVMMVSRALDIDAALVRYYFDSRAGLLVAAARTLTLSFYEKFGEVAAAAGETPEDVLRARIKLLLSFDLNYPYYYRLVSEEVMTSDLPEAVAFREEWEKIGGMQFDTLLSATGIRPVNAAFLRVLLLGACEFFRHGPAVAANVASAEDYQEFLVDILVNGLKNRP